SCTISLASTRAASAGSRRRPIMRRSGSRWAVSSCSTALASPCFACSSSCSVSGVLLHMFRSAEWRFGLVESRGRRDADQRQADAQDGLLLAVDGDVLRDGEHPVLVLAHLQCRTLAEIFLRHGEEQEDRRVAGAAGLLAQLVQFLLLERFFPL